MDLGDVAPYLADRGLLDARTVVDGRLRIEDVSRKNRVFLASAEDTPCYVVKLPADPGDNGIAREAQVLERLGGDGRRSPLAPFLPKAVMYDDAAGVLVLATPRGARDLAQQHASGRLSLTLARQVGRALAALHSVSPRALDGVEPTDPSRLLEIHRPDLFMLRSLSAAGRDLVRVVQRSEELCGQLERLLADQRRESVIHGDLRWDNVLALGREGSARRTRLLLADWELASAGDPALDVGAYFAEYLRAWKRHTGISDPRAPGRRLVDPARALPAMQPAVEAFWEAYAGQQPPPTTGGTRLLRRALEFAGGRLVLAALEEAQTLDELRPSVLSTLQLGANVLRRPDEAAVHLLGIRTYRERF